MGIKQSYNDNLRNLPNEYERIRRRFRNEESRIRRQYWRGSRAHGFGCTSLEITWVQHLKTYKYYKH